MSVPDTYYEQIERRLPRLQRDRILIDGDRSGLLLQIFTDTMIGPIFFELIQRKGNDGFGEGDFRALFETIELDQIRRGVLTAKAPACDSPLWVLRADGARMPGLRLECRQCYRRRRRVPAFWDGPMSSGTGAS